MTSLAFFLVNLTLGLVLSVHGKTVNLIKTEGNGLELSEKFDDAYEWAVIGGVAAAISVYSLLIIIIPPSLVLTMLLSHKKYQGEAQAQGSPVAERFIHRSVITWDRSGRHERAVTATTVNASAAPRIWWARFGAILFIIGIPITFFASAVLMLGLVLVPYEEEKDKEMAHDLVDLTVTATSSMEAHAAQAQRHAGASELRNWIQNNRKVRSSFMETKAYFDNQLGKFPSDLVR